MRRRLIGLSALTLVLAGCGDDGEGTTESKYDAAWQATLAEVEERALALGIPGAAVAIVIDGKLAYSGAVGVRSSAGEPVTVDTLFRSSSALSKPAIAVALLNLEEDGALDVTAPIGSIVPEIQLDSQYAGSINLDLLLSQRAAVELGYRAACGPGKTSVLEFLKSQPLPSLAPPDVVWSYSASGSVVGAAAIEKLSARPFMDEMRDRIFVPAGMATATYDLGGVAASDHALGHQVSELQPTDTPGVTCGERMASTGLYGSVRDHAHFLEALLEPGRLMSEASRAKLEGAARNPGFGASWSYGYQVYGLTYKGVRVLHHYGSSEGFNGGISWVPERRFGVALITNADEGAQFERVWAVEALRWNVMDRFLELEGEPPDNSTPPSTWAKYAGTYIDPHSPNVTITVDQTAAQELTVAIDPGAPTPRVFAQGGLDAPYEGGDLFKYDENGVFGLAGFFAGKDGTIEWASVVTSDTGSYIAQRVP